LKVVKIENILIITQVNVKVKQMKMTIEIKY